MNMRVIYNYELFLLIFDQFIFGVLFRDIESYSYSYNRSGLVTSSTATCIVVISNQINNFLMPSISDVITS